MTWYYECLYYLIKHMIFFQAWYNIMSALKFGVTSTYYNKKCDQYGTLCNEQLTKTTKEDEAILKSKCKTMNETMDLQHTSECETDLEMQSSQFMSNACFSSTPHFPDMVSLEQSSDTSLNHITSALNNATFDNHSAKLSSGFKTLFDNFDIHQKVHNMTEDNQNKDIR